MFTYSFRNEMIVSPGRQRQHYQETDIDLCLKKILFKPTIPIYISQPDDG